MELNGEFAPTRVEPPEGDLSMTVRHGHLPEGQFPTVAQGRAFQHLLENEREVRDSVLQGIYRVYPEWREAYFGCQISSDGGNTYQLGSELPELFPPDNMPEISEAAGLMRLIAPGGIHFHAEESQGYGYVGFSFSCKWDEEHGLGVLTHQGKVLDVGGPEVSFEGPG